MIVSGYEAHFYELSRYAMSSVPIEFERIHIFVKGLIFKRLLFPLCFQMISFGALWTMPG